MRGRTKTKLKLMKTGPGLSYASSVHAGMPLSALSVTMAEGTR